MFIITSERARRTMTHPPQATGVSRTRAGLLEMRSPMWLILLFVFAAGGSAQSGVALSPQSQACVACHEASSPGKAVQAELDEVLNSDLQRWFAGGLTPAEREERKKAAEEFKKRYAQQ
jgi:hypothetical protein